jgi:hypothetical protein
MFHAYMCICDFDSLYTAADKDAICRGGIEGGVGVKYVRVGIQPAGGKPYAFRASRAPAVSRFPRILVLRYFLILENAPAAVKLPASAPVIVTLAQRRV